MTVEERLEKLESDSAEFRQIAGSLRDALTVTAAIQQRQAEVQKAQAESIAHLFQAVDEVTDKLNGLIGFLDNRKN